MRVFLYNEDNPTGKSLAAKLSGARHGQMIAVTPEELKFWKSGSMQIIDVPSDDGAMLRTAATQAPIKKEPEAAGAAKSTPGPKPPDNAPKSPAA